MVEEPQQRRLGARPMAGVLQCCRMRNIHDLSCRAMVAQRRFYVASVGAETGPSAFIRGSSCCVAGTLAKLSGNEARSGLEDGERLAFGDYVVEFDKKGFELAGRRRRHRDFHL